MSHERQKPVSDAYREGWDRTFRPAVRKGEQAKPTQPHRDKTKYHRPSTADLSRKSGGW